MESLGGKVAVVTGGASGIGYAMATRFLEQGMSVAIGDVQKDALDEAVETLGASGTVLGVLTDVADREQVQALHDQAVADLGGAHIVCNNAGVGAGGLLWETTADDWQWTIGVNLMGVVHGIQAFVPGFIAQGEGHVVNTASMAGLTSPMLMGPYNATKHAVVTISETLYNELQTLAGGTVGVSVLCPGWVRTNIARSSRNRPEALGGGTDDPTAGLLDGVLANGMDPLEVADLVLDGVRDDRFYLLTHDGWNVAVKDRVDHLLAGDNPRVGLPPGIEVDAG